MGYFEPDKEELEYHAKRAGVCVKDLFLWGKLVRKVRENVFIGWIYGTLPGLIIGALISTVG